MKFFYSAATDGVDHINVYSKGKTELGRLLTNFSHSPFECEDGHFESIEGYWYWLSIRDERLRALYGFQAKQLGQELKEGLGRLHMVEDFNERIKKAIAIKILTNDYLCNLLAESQLPLTHYYQYGDKVKPLPQYQWMINHIANIRKDLQEALNE